MKKGWKKSARFNKLHMEPRKITHMGRHCCGLCSSLVHKISITIGAAVDVAERDKHNRYIELKVQHIFTPLALDFFVSVGPETELFLSKLGKLMARKTGEPRSLDFMLQHISVAIQRRNAVKYQQHLL